MTQRLISYLLQAALLISFLSNTVVSLAEPNSFDSPFDSYGRISWEAEKVRLDNFAIALKQDSDTIGYIIYHVGENESVNSIKRRINRAVAYLTNELKIPKDRIITLFGGCLEKRRVILQPIDKDNLKSVDKLKSEISETERLNKMTIGGRCKN